MEGLMMWMEGVRRGIDGGSEERDGTGMELGGR